jgi:calcineurin-like phosphoesterase family protein
MTVWFASDHHFGHKKVAGLRGFDDTNHHDAFIIDRHNDLVKDTDIVYFLGDLSSGTNAATLDALDCVSMMKGRKRLIAGNHCPIHPMNRDSHKWFDYYLDVFDSVAPFGRTSVHGTRVLLSHFPYETDRGEVRYTQYRLRNEGHWLLHGHLHVAERLTSSREIHVGLDAWDLAPVADDVIAAMIEQLSEEVA